MRVVITGGTGLIGRALSRTLLTDGHSVQVLSRSADARRAIPGSELLVWNGRDPGPWSEALDGADAVVNLAGASLAGSGSLPARWTPAYKAVIRDSRLDAGRALVAAISAVAATGGAPPKVLLQASGIGIYGSWREEAPICTETCVPGDDSLARLARDWEDATAPVEALGVRRAVLRTGVVLDRDAGALPRIAMPIRFGAGGPLGSGRQSLAWIHLDDEVRAIRFLIAREDLVGVFNLVAPEACSNGGFGRTLARVLRRPFWLPVPAFVLRGGLGEAADLVLTGQHAMPARLIEAGFEFRYPRLEPALRALYP